YIYFFFTSTAPPEIYPLSLHDALPIWNVFAKRDKVDLAINLNRLAAVRYQQRCIVIVPFFEIERAEHQIGLGRCRKIRHETVTLAVLIAHRIGHRAFRPDQQIWRRIRSQRDLAQSLKTYEHFAGEMRIEFLQLWNTGLDRGDTQRRRRYHRFWNCCDV